ncbi:hypothetical protein CHH91_04715 [Virgibacillus sp. 7505]|uniref:hypothetical protein n=1 Tax=Virgibacillus sp. 7505 TaxID=2022548 RepID=UPI000BA5527C|nr:hypothetical protein [Virgibacillus sp. 7505]PAE17311.1 hypothetical protein CHH91_04715 [Virgibacillus sp. 7505]
MNLYSKLFVFVLGLLIFLLTPLVSEAESYSVTEEEAIDKINQTIEAKPYLNALKGGQVNLVHSLYGENENVIAYYYEIQTGSTDGYFIVAADKRLDPLPQYGVDGTLEFEFSNMQEGDKAYYLGVNSFVFAKSAEAAEQKFEELKSEFVPPLETESQVSAFSTSKADIAEAEKEYNEAINQEFKTVDLSSEVSPGWSEDNSGGFSTMGAGDTRYKVLNVDRIWQRRGGMKGQNSNCGPATGAMIIDYYHDHLGYNVRDNAYYGSWAALSNHLRIDMGTLAGGTTLRGYAAGMYNHVLHTSSGSAWSSKYVPDAVGTTAQTQYIGAINSADPAGFKFDLFVSSGTEFKYHFVAGIGYDRDGSFIGDLHVGYKNPDGGENNNGTHWFDWTANDDDMGFAYLK